jgi:hypothetical protein
MYNLSQYRCIAREFVRAGGVFAHCAAALRENYETFPNIGELTIKRISRKAVFQPMLAEQEAILKMSKEDAELQAETIRASAEARGIQVLCNRTLKAIRGQGLRDGKDLDMVLKAIKVFSRQA